MVKNFKFQTPNFKETPSRKLQNAGWQSQRDCILQPRVARYELPWVLARSILNPKRVSSRARPHGKKELGALTTELLVAMALLTFALFPLAYSFASERRLARSYYQRAVAMEIVDGEMEVLLAGEWRSYQPGLQEYHVKGAASTNLPPGKFQLEVAKEKVRLEWLPSLQRQGGAVMREGTIR
jgi:hypothetical protein